MAWGKLLIKKQADYIAQLQVSATSSIKEAQDLEMDGLDIGVALKGPNSIQIATQHGLILYQIYFNPADESSGWYEVSGGEFAGTGTVVATREISTPTFQHSYYLLVESKAAEYFMWRVGLRGFSNE